VSFIDIFAWIVFIPVIAILIAVFVALGMMPGASRESVPLVELASSIADAFATSSIDAFPLNEWHGIICGFMVR
jgi:hypothetical protein